LISPGGSLYGWRFATDLEVETMATALCANPASCSSADFNGWSSDTDGVVNIILGQLGWIGGDHARGVIADVPDGTSNRFEVYMNTYYPTYPGEDYILSAPSSSWRSSSEQHPDMGSFLVSGVVPIPGAVWLLGSGLIGIVGVRRKFKK